MILRAQQPGGRVHRTNVHRNRRKKGGSRVTREPPVRRVGRRILVASVHEPAAPSGIAPEAAKEAELHGGCVHAHAHNVGPGEPARKGAVSGRWQG